MKTADVAVVDKTLNLRVSADVRAQLINSTIRSFKDDELRATEKKAKEAVLKELQKLTNLYNLTEKKVLEKYKFMHYVTTVDLPSTINIEVGIKEFTLPNGEKVLRGEKVKFGVPKKLEYSNSLLNPKYSDEYSYMNSRLELGSGNSIHIPVEHASWDRNLDIYFGRHNKDDWSSNLIGGYVPESLIKALEAWYVASDARYKKEVALIRAMVNVIKGAKKYYEIVSVWPDAEKTIRQIVTAPLAPNKALTLMISEKDKTILCEYFSKKKQFSAACNPSISEAAD